LRAVDVDRRGGIDADVGSNDATEADALRGRPRVAGGLCGARHVCIETDFLEAGAPVAADEAPPAGRSDGD